MKPTMAKESTSSTIDGLELSFRRLKVSFFQTNIDFDEVSDFHKLCSSVAEISHLMLVHLWHPTWMCE
jgi:hypothetical protein